MPIVIRLPRADELAHAEELVARSINDLTTRHGFGSIAAARTPDFQAFCLHDDPRGVWLAEDDGEMAGFALSWVCGPLWFLAELFVASGRQGQGIGNELLDRTLQHAAQAGATRKSLITFAFNVVSQGLYTRHGLLPRVPIHLCSAERASLAQHPSAHALRTVPILARSADFAKLRRLDAETLGFSREKHHKYLLGDPRMKGVFLEEGGHCIGYAYISQTGHIGPMATVRPQVMPAAFGTALAIAAAGESRQVSVFVPGTSEVLTIAATQGMQFTLPMMLMSAGDSVDWTRYLPRNPGFM